MKKLCGILLVLVLAVSVMGLHVFAADSLVLEVSGATASQGDTVTITVSAKNNPGIGGIVAGVSYDKDVLTLVSAAKGIDHGTWSIDTIASDAIISWYDTTAFEADGAFITLTFKVLDTAESGDTTVGLSFGSWDSVSDIDGNDIEGFSVQSGTITVACEHENLTQHKATDATCTETGNTAYWECDNCGKLFSDANATTVTTLNDVTIAAKGHTWDEGEVAKEATETERGEKHFVCTVCDAEKTEPIPALNEKDTPVATEEPAASAPSSAGNEEESSVPKNGDEAPIALWAMVGLFSLMGLVVVGKKKG